LRISTLLKADFSRVFFYVQRGLSGYEPQAKAVKLAQLGGEGLLRGTSCPP